jgi:hypothetical protein
MDNENKNRAADSTDDVDVNGDSGELEEDKEVLLGGTSDNFTLGKDDGRDAEGDGASQNHNPSDNLTAVKIEEEGSVVISKSKVVLVRKLLSNIKENSEKLSNILAGFITDEDEALISAGQAADENFKSNQDDTGEGKVIEGVFDGENMIGPDGKQYSVPANYASKSKLVEGDILKLTITPKGTFVYKQISPIGRSRVIGELEKGSDGNYYVKADGKRWRVLTASITYFKGESGDEVVVLIPKTGESKWAAVENIVKR